MALHFPLKQRSLTFPTSLSPLKSKNFSLFWTGAFISSIGFWIQMVGQGWQVLQLTNSALLLGLVSFAAMLPNFVLSLFGGVFVDRLNRRYVLLVTQCIYMLSAALLGIFTTLHIITVWLIIVVALINGIFSSVGFPAWQTFIGDIVPPEHLKQAIALNSVQFNLSRVIGPAVGGISIGIVGLAGAYYLNAISYIAVLIPLLLIRFTYQRRIKEKQSMWQGLQAGLSYVQGRPLLRTTLVLQLALAFLIFPYVTLLPIFARDIFHSGAAGLGVMNAAAGIGAMLGAILMVILSQRLERSLKLLLLLCLGGGLACLSFALSTSKDFSLLVLVILGICAVMSTTATNTTIQSTTPEHMRGRVVSIWIMITFGFGPFGNLCAGWIAQFLGAPLTLVLGGSLCAGIALLSAFRQWRFKQHTVRENAIGAARQQESVQKS